MRRRGRPRKTGLRYANGRLVAIQVADHGTAQLQAKRRRLVGNGADPVLSTSPLDILQARGLIDADAYAAGCWFRSTARVVFGRAHLKDSLDESCGTEPPEVALRRTELRYCFLAECLEARERGRLLELLHFSLVPPWLIATVNNGVDLRPSHQRERAATLKVLARLAHVYRSWRDHGPRSG